jgi:N-acyl amino acid synthase FeeM
MFAELQSGVKSPRTFADRIDRLLDRVQYRRAETAADLDAILRVRYEAYLKEGAISPNDAGRLEDPFDDVDNVYNFGIFIDGELASALRLHRVCHVRQKSPALETFGDILAPELRKSKLILDPNRFVANYKLARLYPGLPYVTLRVGILACVHFGIDLATMTVRAEHQAFYKRAFFAYPVCPPREYPLLSKPISLLFLNFVRDADRIFERHPYWLSSEAERQALFGSGPTSARFRTTAATIASTESAEDVMSTALRTPAQASPPIAAAR